ncbi:MAG: radical SAM protein [Oscillospiraceae bacterium]|nr:radical SAM protein [Oscillospiraceae bacterium]
MNDREFEQYLTEGVENVVKDLLKASLFHPAESAFMLRFAASCKRADAVRHSFEEEGEHIPPFLIASITSVCNLHCAGCYARSLDTCSDGSPVRQLSSEQWGRVFSEATDLGISFILLAGGEPMVRSDVIEKAAEYPDILFPIFTNGTLIDDDRLAFLDKHRNLIPVFSVEGGQLSTDARRGQGIFDKVQSVMLKMQKKRLVFGASVTVTTENISEVTSDLFIKNLTDSGCKLIFYIEYVPTEHSSKALALNDELREQLAARVDELRKENGSALFISFPGDEKLSDGCLAAGRGFFHINSHGGAEPCPFSPYSDVNVIETSLREALKSKLFLALRSGDILLDEHEGGCVLFQKREEVEKLLLR